MGYAAETENVILNALTKLRAKGVDLIIANDVSDPAIGFGSEDNSIYFVDAEGTEATGVMSKDLLAEVIIDHILKKM